MWTITQQFLFTNPSPHTTRRFFSYINICEGGRTDGQSNRYCRIFPIFIIVVFYYYYFFEIVSVFFGWGFWYLLVLLYCFIVQHIKNNINLLCLSPHLLSLSRPSRSLICILLYELCDCDGNERIFHSAFFKRKCQPSNLLPVNDVSKKILSFFVWKIFVSLLMLCGYCCFSGVQLCSLSFLIFVQI